MKTTWKYIIYQNKESKKIFLLIEYRRIYLSILSSLDLIEISLLEKNFNIRIYV